MKYHRNRFEIDKLLVMTIHCAMCMKPSAGEQMPFSRFTYMACSLFIIIYVVGYPEEFRLIILLKEMQCCLQSGLNL